MEAVLVEVDQGIAEISINRPDALNALTESAMQRIVELVAELDVDSGVRVLILTAVGDRAFCAGRDLKERASTDARGARVLHPMRGIHRNLFESVWDCRTPTIAAIGGDAVGAGFELALACDMKVVSRHARFALPEAKRGMGAVFGATILSRTVPPAIYAEWAYLGEFIPAAEAARWGVVNRVVDGPPLPHARELARELMRRSPVSLARLKATLNRGRELPVAAALRADFHPDPYTSDDRVEGVRAFVEKREPRWGS